MITVNSTKEEIINIVETSKLIFFIPEYKDWDELCDDHKEDIIYVLTMFLGEENVL